MHFGDSHVGITSFNVELCCSHHGVLLWSWLSNMTTIETHQKNEIKMSSKATTTKKKKKKTIQVDTKREGERMEKKRKKGRKKGENNLTYLTLLELQDIRSPQ